MMNTSAYNPTNVHQEHNVIGHPTHTAGATYSYLHSQGATSQLHQQQLNAIGGNQHQPSIIPTVGNTQTLATTSVTDTATPATLFDPRQLQGNVATNGGRFYTTTTAATSTTTPGAGGAAAGAGALTHHHHHHPNTILITNNFAQQHYTAAAAAAAAQQQRSTSMAGNYSTNNNNNNNIRIVTTLPTGALQPEEQQQHEGTLVAAAHQTIYNINNNLGNDKEAPTHHHHHNHQESLQQIYQQHLPTMLPTAQHFAPTHFTTAGADVGGVGVGVGAATQHAIQLQLPTAAAQQFYLTTTTDDNNDPNASNLTSNAATTVASTTTTKMMTALPALTGTVAAVATATPSAAIPTIATSNATSAATSNGSTVVLDRINICINNHYTDSTATSSAAAASTATSATGCLTVDSMALPMQPQSQQPSPIIPTIQHKAIMDNGSTSAGGGGGSSLLDPYASNDSVLIIDEPDSTTTTTTPNTPPTTPDANNSPTSTTTATISLLVSSPTATVVTPATTTTTAITTKEVMTGGDNVIELRMGTENSSSINDTSMNLICGDGVGSGVDGEIITTTQEKSETNSTTTPTPLTPPTPTPPTPPASSPSTTNINNSPTTTITTMTPKQITLEEAITATEDQQQQQEQSTLITFTIGEDVFVCRQDGRLYLGTVIDAALHQQYLIRFDDKSELWCSVEEMRKFGGGAIIGTGSGDGDGANRSVAAADTSTQQMCVACKQRQHKSKVEICERCGRGYHRSCTMETMPGSGEWLCKRCAKPMNVRPKSNSVCRQLPYHTESLHWDEKHRTNEEEIYCYCGRTGQYDRGMLQCCKCRNWFHTHCMQNFNISLLRGDGFFVFCCTVCNEGKEFLRRLQMTWIDLLHLVLYNLSIIKKHHKFHHLHKDILPFVTEHIHELPLPKECTNLEQSELLKRISSTLKGNTDRFVCGRESKRDLCYYALRNIGPPISPKINIQPNDMICDELLVEKLKLNVHKIEKHHSFDSQFIDVYEFRLEDDEKFTSDDEIPIKHIMEKAKKSKISLPPQNEKASNLKAKSKKFSHAAAASNATFEKLDLDDENANDGNCNIRRLSKKSPQKVNELKFTTNILDGTKNFGLKTTVGSVGSVGGGDGGVGKSNDSKSSANHTELKSSRKRKAFTLSKSYKEIAAEAAAKRYDSSRICDSSSDENSSSSRGTSLDVIIPPPKNFLGLNNPFRIITPKKNLSSLSAIADAAKDNGSNGQRSLNFGRCGTMIKSSIFNTPILDFSSMAAFKNAGIFPNLSTSNLAKAAGQPRTVRTIKRRLSAKDITIGPNQEVRRRRTRRLSSNIEVISTTTINPIPSNFFSIHAKDLISTTATASSSTATATATTTLRTQSNIINHLPPPPSSSSTSISSSSASSSPPASIASSVESIPPHSTIPTQQQQPTKPTHGRRLRQRPQKISPSNSRRSSMSGVSTSSNSSSAASHLGACNATGTTAATAATGAGAVAGASAGAGPTIMQDLKQSVNKYFGAVNRIESGEQFSIRAKRQLANGQMQYLIEWGSSDLVATSALVVGGQICLE